MDDFDLIPRARWVRYWEERSVAPRHSGARAVRFEKLVNLSRQVAQFYDKPIPSVHPVDLREASRADIRGNRIYLGFGDRWELPLLHHAAVLLSEQRAEPSYGRAFMTVAIDAYSRFLGIDIAAMEAGAAHFDLDFTPSTEFRRLAPEVAIRSLA